MKVTLITAIDAGPGKEPPREIVYIPDGEHRITPLSQPEGVWVKIPFGQGHAIAAALQSDLERLMSASVKPFLDFEHTRKAPASGHPVSFRYQPGRGIMLAVDWSASGRRALMGRDVEYFSPEVYVDANGIPTSLPEKGPIGGLVQNPAFRNMQRIAASAAGGATDPDMEKARAEFGSAQHHAVMDGKAQDMDEAALVVASENYELFRRAFLVTAVRGDTKEAIERLAEKHAGQPALAELKALAENIRKKSVQDGMEVDEDQAFVWAVQERPDLYERYTDELFDGMDEAQEKADAEARAYNEGKGDPRKDPVLAAAANDLIAAGEAPNADAALLLAFERDPALYERYMEQLSPGRAKSEDPADIALQSQLMSAASSLIAAGEASNQEAAIALAVERDPSLYDGYLVMAGLGARRGEKAPEPAGSPLARAVQALITAGEAYDHERAMVLAVERDPDLYGEYLATLRR